MAFPSKNNDPSLIAEMQSLIDDLFHGRLDNAGMERIESLIVQDQALLQLYIEELDLHCELVEQADQRPPDVAAVSGMRRYSDSCALKQSRQTFRINLLLSIASLLVAIGMGWGIYSAVIVPSPVGTVASLSSETQSSPTLALGQILRAGQTIHLNHGVVSIQLKDVMVDLVGPVTATLTRSTRLSLRHGTVISRVETGGKGFSVITPNGEVVDLGTEFLVRYTPSEGTYVSVRRGEVHARSIDWRGTPTQAVGLTTARAAKISPSSETVQEIAFSKEEYQKVDRSRGGIRRITGAIRTPDSIPTSLKSEQLTTPNQMLIIPERQNVVLEEPLTVETLSGITTLPKGSVISSYLIHYDPTSAVRFAPRGGVTFFNEISAIVVSNSGLRSTDALFGLPETTFESRDFRELELEEDEILLSDDRKTVSFYWGVSPPYYLDQARVLVRESSPHP